MEETIQPTTTGTTYAPYFEPQKPPAGNDSAPGLAGAPVVDQEQQVNSQSTTRADLNAPFKPQLIRVSSLRVCWAGVLVNSAWEGPAGISYRADSKGTQLLEYRDTDGRLRGVLVLYGPRCEYERPGIGLLIVDPECRRRGVGTALLQDAARRGFKINWSRQSYTRSGWAVVRNFLQRQRTDRKMRVLACLADEYVKLQKDDNTPAKEEAA